MSKIPVTELQKAITILRFSRVSVFHQSKHTFPIQWHSKEHQEEAFRLYNEYSGWSYEPEEGNEEASHEHVFNWLLEECTTDLVPAHDAQTGKVLQGFPTSNN